jgi:predicted Kef-type K+ transport protein
MDHATGLIPTVLIGYSLAAIRGLMAATVLVRTIP